MRTIAIIVAGGSGTRFGAQVPKQFLELAGKPILMRTIETFWEHFDNLIVTLPADQIGQWQLLCDKYSFTIPHRVVVGGETRWHSVKNALDSIGDVGDVDDRDLIAVHDGVRPLVSDYLIMDAIDIAMQFCTAIPVVPLNDSVRQKDENGNTHALDRSSLFAVQTPQVFRARMLIEAYQQPYDPKFTDDASVVEQQGNFIKLIDGDPRNLKITRPMDLVVAEYLLNNA